MSKTAVKPISRKSNLVTQEHEKEILIYDLLIDKAFSLNETSSLIWNLCNGNNSVAEITEGLSKKLNSSINEDFVWLALEQLKKDNLLANGEEISIDFGGLSRREVIRKVGFATLVALPIISSLIAPAAINASSSTGRLQTSNSCSGWNRAQGCQCSNASGAGNPGVPPASQTGTGNSGIPAGQSNCDSSQNLECYNNCVRSSDGGTGVSCCSSV